GIPKLRIEEAAARKQARIDSGQDIIVGVNRYRLSKEDPITTLEVDNQTVRNSQIERLNQVKTTRNKARVAKTLDNLTSAAKTILQEVDNKEFDKNAHSDTDLNGNLLALAV